MKTKLRCVSTDTNINNLINIIYNYSTYLVHRAYLILSFALISSLTSSMASSVSSFAAPPLSEIQADRAAASRQYYQALTQLGPNATPAQQQELRTKYLLPFQVKTQNAMSQSIGERIEATRQKIYKIFKDELDATVLKDFISHSNETTNNHPGTRARKSEENAHSKSNGNSIKIDGSKIPKVIDFSNTNK